MLAWIVSLKRVGFSLLGCAFVLLSTTAALIKLRSHESGRSLVVSWEGLFISRNFRDAGESFNECLGDPLMTEGVVFRANRWFSGFSCDDVGAPDEIYSLNFDPATSQEYFCHTKDGKIIGKHFNADVVINDVEFLESWSNLQLREGICGFFSSALASVAKGKRLLTHCNAGQDRTGTVAAIIQALVAEHSKIDSARWLDAIECDYRRSPRLSSEKFDRQRRFITSVLATSSVSEFLADRCNISEVTINEAVGALSER